MIRKDVKLGFAIGGVFLAVLVVYLMISSDSGKKNPNGATPGGATIAGGSGTDPTVNNVDVKPDASGNDDRSVVKPIETVANRTGTSGTTGTPGTSSTDSAAKPPVVAGSSTPDAGATKPNDNTVASAEPKRDANADLWESTLSRGELMMSETPTRRDAGTATPSVGTPITPRDAVNSRSSSATPANPSLATSANSNSPATQPSATPDNGAASASNEPSGLRPITLATSGEKDRTATDSSVGSSGSSSASTPATPPAAGQRTHVVQKGETLAKISQVAYGSPNYYPHILRANPGLDANKMKPGTTITLPPESDVVAKKPAEKTAAETKTSDSSATPPLSAGVTTPRVTASEQPVDPKSQYRVESGDSLYRISKKLYGNGSQVDKIYEANKDAIGSDRAKLKLHMLLKLPEPPTVTASR